MAIALAAVAGPFVVPAAADSGTGAGTSRPDAGSLSNVAPAAGSEVVMAGASGFLTSAPDNSLRWTRYADGSTVDLGAGLQQWRTTQHLGSVSDIVVLERGFAGAPDDRVELHDMSTGEVTTIALGSRLVYAGAVGSTVLACPYPSGGNVDCGHVHLLSMADGVLTERQVTGLPAGARSVGLFASAPGSLTMAFKDPTGADDDVHYAVLDLASGVATQTHLTTPTWAVTALSPAYLASMTDAAATGTAQVSVEDRHTGVVTRIATHTAASDSLVGLVGDWALYGTRNPLTWGSADADLSFRAVPVKGGPSRKILDHATSLAPAPDGSLLVMGGTVAHGEGVYRISAGADGAPAAELVVGTGQPLGITLVSSNVPAVAALDVSPWRARWQLSRGNAEVTLTLRSSTTGVTEKDFLYPSDTPDSRVGMDTTGLLHIDWDGWTNSSQAPNGDWTWHVTAKPLNGLGPDLSVGGTFRVTRHPAPHDYTDNGSPDLLARDPSGVLWREDTYHNPWNPQLGSTGRVKVGGGWNIYNRMAAVGNIAGGSAGDLVARDTSGVLWLYLGTGKGTFATRTRIGAGWNAYTQLTGMGDLSGDGRADLVARDRAGYLWLYKGTGNWKAPYAARTRIGGGWNTYNQIAAVGNIAGGSAGDLVARDTSGVLWLYLGTGKGTFAARTRIGAGWNTYTQLIGIGDSDVDGKFDLLAVDRDGSAWQYRGTGNTNAPFAKRELSSLFFAQTYNSVA
ncbi:VCBS repeat-containing protein [Streptomyces sp. HPF1205]|uniref:FG-GAP repeat domain-containing protein n=1 Tax=Streptomyces sp. HPF1205 TaxID=2873262 RepID=UPI001CEC7E4C|nr:VCBS repeat-containing protein [Streptomyces sp. HPF1205]